MLWVRIDGGELEATPASLAELVFEGKVDRHTLARLPENGGEQPLELSLGWPHCEALADALHRRLQMICSMDSSSVDLQDLCAQVERLCQWRWSNAVTAARFFWTAGWLNELAGRSKRAIDYYDAFLLLPCGESHLRLLALNNRGVLRIGRGRLDGVRDLARAGIWEGEGQRAESGFPRRDSSHPQYQGLPAACFNLLNLVNVSFSAADLLRAVDEELTGFFSGLSEDCRTLWLGQPAGASVYGSRAVRSGPRPGEDDRDQPILRDPTYRRLNVLVTRLAAQARGLAVDGGTGRAPAGWHTSFSPPVERAISLFRQLWLWDCRADGGRASPETNGTGFQGEHGRYTDAASLLLSDDIPSLLMGRDDPLIRAEQAAQEELAVIEGYLAAGQYELAGARLQVQRQVLVSLNTQGGLAALLARVDALTERASRLQAQERQLDLQKTCAAFVSDTARFCSLTDLSQAQTALADLTHRLQQFQAQLPPQAASEIVGLLDELAARGQRHVQDLRRAQVETMLGDARRHVRENWPGDTSRPAPESVFRALAQCRLHDPENWIEDWTALENQLEAHQGRYYTERALSALRVNPGSWDQIEGDLVQGLWHDPACWMGVAPLFGLMGGPGGPASVPSCNSSSEIHNPPRPTAQAGQLLESVLRQIGSHAGKCLRLWRCVEKTLAPVLAATDAETVTRAQVLARTCLEHWPAGGIETPGRTDPRHPVNRFLEACEKARCLAQAQQWLEMQPPELDKARRLLAGLLGLGLDTRDQLRRAATAFYLAQFHEQDTPSMQREVLAGLEDWVQAVAEEEVPPLRGPEIHRQIERIRESVAGRFEPIPCGGGPDEPVPNEMEYLPLGGGFGEGSPTRRNAFGNPDREGK